jgi:error-prone DNA polymerase
MTTIHTNGIDFYINKFIKKDKDIKILVNSFKIEIPRNLVYYKRLIQELKLIIHNNFVKCFLQVIEILEITKGIPHIIRGSSGSSLVCYLLGITSFDPIKYNISLGRFMNDKRKNLPDIDIDFPYNKRDFIFSEINKKWRDKVARISNHNMFKEKSAAREAIKSEGYNKRIPKYYSLNKIFDNDKEKVENVKSKKEDLIGTFRCYSLHCGGIVIFDEDIPDDLLVKDSQLIFNKHDVEDNGLIKIDILSNRGLAQLFDIENLPLTDYPTSDFETMRILIYGNNVGLTFAESPGMRKLFLKYRPKCIDDIAKCLALIRPSASHSHYDNKLIYDDDAIQYIQTLLDCDEGTADLYRKAFSKRKYNEIREFEEKIKYRKDKRKIIDNLSNLQYYSFCKSHAYSYAQLVWCLAYQKTHNPIQFWLSTLNNCNSMYRTWVHMNEAKKAGIKLTLGKRPWKLNPITNTITSNSTLNVIKSNENKIWQYKKYGYWTQDEFLDNMYYKEEKGYLVKFRGLIATYRKYKTQYYVTIGCASDGKLYDIIVPFKLNLYHKDYIEGTGYKQPFGIKAKTCVSFAFGS